ncbi:hypothetical protein AND4_11509 [Vibrio sp. AND4]|nr:hypothetical protein AND4_11509 [Vibrio sp. AND4]
MLAKKIYLQMPNLTSLIMRPADLSIQNEQIRRNDDQGKSWSCLQLKAAIRKHDQGDDSTLLRTRRFFNMINIPEI